MSKHTKGPLEVNGNAIHKRISPHYGTCVAIVEQKADIHLFKSAYESYDRHFGENAVAAAEADVLGKCIEALKAWEEFRSMTGGWPRDAMFEAHDRFDRLAKEALALAEQKEQVQE